MLRISKILSSRYQVPAKVETNTTNAQIHTINVHLRKATEKQIHIYIYIQK